MWVRYKHRFAYGEDGKWSYIEVDEKDFEEWIEDDKDDPDFDIELALGEYIEDAHNISRQYDYSDKYRGFKYDKLEGLPPNEEIMRRLERAESNANYWLNEATKLRKMLDDVNFLSKNDVEV
jgi:hypothetical protein